MSSSKSGSSGKSSSKSGSSGKSSSNSGRLVRATLVKVGHLQVDSPADASGRAGPKVQVKTGQTRWPLSSQSK